jgi:ABC-2 type transport system ATP-binding protein
VFSGTAVELRMLAPAAVHALRTSDDLAALNLAERRPGVRVTLTSPTDGGLEVSADVDALDAYVVALGCAGVAVRTLERRARSLESLFLELTSDLGTEQPAASLSRGHSDRVHASTAKS